MEDLVSVGYFRGPLDAVLAGIQNAGFDGAVLELDGDPSNELFDFAEAVTAGYADLLAANRHARSGGRQWGPLRFGGGPLFIPVTEANIARLRDIADRHAEPEVANSLRVLSGDAALLDAPDVGDNDILVSRRLSAQTVSAIQRALDGVR